MTSTGSDKTRSEPEMLVGRPRSTLNRHMQGMTMCVVAAACTSAMLLVVFVDSLTSFIVFVSVQTFLIALLIRERNISNGMFWFVLLIGTVTRIGLVMRGPLMSFDVYYYSVFASKVLSGQVPFRDFYFPYPLPTIGVFVLAQLIHPSVTSFKFLFALVDVLNALMIRSIGDIDENFARGNVLSAAYLLCPATMIESALNGHFEALTMLFALLGTLYLVKSRPRTAAAMSLIGAMIKYVPLALQADVLQTISRLRNRLLFVVLVSVITAGSFLLPVIVGGHASILFRSAVGVSGQFYDYSFPYFVSALSGLAPSIGQMLLLGAGGVYMMYVLRRGDAAQRLGKTLSWMVVTLTLFVIGVGILLYPFSSTYSAYYWRRLPEVCISQGIALIILGLVSAGSRRDWSTRGMLSGTLFILFLMMLYQPVFYVWYVIFVLPVALLKSGREGKIILLLSLILYPSVSAGEFTPTPEENRWPFGQDIDEAMLEAATVWFSTETGHDSRFSVDDGTLLFTTESYVNDSFVCQIGWNNSHVRLYKSSVVVIRMMCSTEPTYQRPFQLNVVAGNSTPGGSGLNETVLTPDIDYIPSHGLLTYIYRALIEGPASFEYFAIRIIKRENITGTHWLRLDLLRFCTDLNVPTTSWLFHIPVMTMLLVGSIGVVVGIPRHASWSVRSLGSLRWYLHHHLEEYWEHRRQRRRGS
ncbi:MAG: glycosyltransferase family 87 protein [Candidatus Thorarchaeota archaeon]